jgi:hypothetical protein
LGVEVCQQSGKTQNLGGRRNRGNAVCFTSELFNDLELTAEMKLLVYQPSLSQPWPRPRECTFLRFVFFLLTHLFVLSALSSYAEDKNGVSPNTVSLPSGPGSIEGLGDSFQPMLNTGTSRYGVKLILPTAPAGNTPELIAQYDSGTGYGLAGLGWSYGPKGIRRRLDKGLPLFVDEDNNIDDDHDRQVDEADEKDIFIGPDGEELVDLGNGMYRARIEGNFTRYRKIGSHWEVDLKNGTLLVYGGSSASQITSADQSLVYEWLLEQQIDVNGNTIQYFYSSYPGSENQKYLKEIRYGPGPPTWSTFYFVSFTYEDRPDWRKDFPKRLSGKNIKTISSRSSWHPRRSA